MTSMQCAPKHAPDFDWPADLVTLVIPTFNSARHLDIMLAYYREILRVPVTVFVDIRSTDGTHSLAERLAAQALPIQNSGDVVEDVIGAMSDRCPTEWVLRIDDDELPSMAMIRFVSAAVRHDRADAYAFPRYQCIVSPAGEVLYSGLHSLVDHLQWRLYRKDKVTYSARLHTPGFEAGKVRGDIAPNAACMVHLDWAVHTYAERAEKVERYDQHTTNSGTKWRAYYLYEEDSRFSNSLCLLDELREFDSVALSLAERFPHLCVKSPKSPTRGNDQKAEC